MSKTKSLFLPIQYNIHFTTSQVPSLWPGVSLPRLVNYVLCYMHTFSQALFSSLFLEVIRSQTFWWPLSVFTSQNSLEKWKECIVNQNMIASWTGFSTKGILGLSAFLVLQNLLFCLSRSFYSICKRSVSQRLLFLPPLLYTLPRFLPLASILSAVWCLLRWWHFTFL